MKNLCLIREFLKDEDATTAVEYAVMLAGIIIAIIGGITVTGGGAKQWWENIDAKIKAATT